MSDLTVSVSPVGVGQSETNALLGRITASLSKGRRAGEGHSATTLPPPPRLLSFQMCPPEEKSDGGDAFSRRYVSVFYDYEKNCSLIVEGSIDAEEPDSVIESAHQPLPDWDEFQAAVQVLRGHPALAGEELHPYRPMPPYEQAARPDGRVGRTIMVGLAPAKGFKYRHEIVGVDLAGASVLRYDRGAPAGANASMRFCGPPAAGQPTSARNVPGQYEVVVSQAGTELWRFTAVRPSASSGTNGSGVELVAVRYRGKLVLGRAHAPILNVLYGSGGHGCGPAYRDWQWEEGMIQADGDDVAPGFRRCRTPAQTIFESGTDRGNFFGVAIYTAGDEVVLVSELEAGWYRYVSEWRFGSDGVIRPRFGFAGVQNSCVCESHHHHVYWRFDFDISTAANNRVREFNSPPISGDANLHTLEFETRREKSFEHNRHWLVENTVTGDSYALVPGPNDGQADSDFGVGDLWVLRNRGGSEFDDGQGFTTNPSRAKAQIDRFVRGEAVNGHDVVVWYAGHFLHDVHDEDETPHIVGPELRPVSW